MATKKRVLQAESKSEESISKAFWRGFFWPFRFIWQCLAWLSHKPPFKQIGHLIRKIANMRVVKFVAKVIGIRYIVRSWRELRQVSWPTFRESARLVVAVLVFSVAFGTFVAILDFGLNKIFENVILK
ncbi:preprotein translocase subunit SecE [Candidatus Saccharibacteria bacterium]|nr:preprotein translocase subunit SecE [Candidatus Saccharibacteria bacterium]